jgi:hypothetical protein
MGWMGRWWHRRRSRECRGPKLTNRISIRSLPIRLVSSTYPRSRLPTRPKRRRRARALAVPRSLAHPTTIHTRPRVHVCAHLLVDVDEDARVGVFVDAREEHSRGRGGAAPRYGDLVARGVELGLVQGAGGVEGDDFGAQQVVARGDVGGDFDVDCVERLSML